MRMLICRPSEPMTKYTMKLRRGKVKWNFHNRDRQISNAAGKMPLNKHTLWRMHSRLHYLACHSPKKVMQQWNRAYKIFYHTHFGKSAGYFRYLNHWSLGA